jgi:phosphatidylglycerophosphatase A
MASESPAEGFVPENAAPRWAWLVATVFGVGNLRPGPGTWGSLVALIVWAAGARLVPLPWRTPAVLVVSALVLAVGIRAAGRVARELAIEDPSNVVIDEVAGQMLAFAGVPLHWKSLLAAFILFRVFDILKPPPLRRLECIPGGAGIMLDDIGAGLYALVGVHLLLHFGILN